MAEHSWPRAVDLLFDLVACELFWVVDEQTDDLCVVVAFVPSLSARSWSRPTCFAIARSLVRPMPKLVSPPVRSPISFQFASPRASRFSLSRSTTSVFVMGRVYCRLILGSERRGKGRGRWTPSTPLKPSSRASAAANTAFPARGSIFECNPRGPGRDPLL